MQYALLIYESPEDFASRSADQADEPYIGAWRTYYRSMVDAGVYAGGQALDTPATGTTVLHSAGKRQIQDGPYANTKEQLGGLVLLDLPSLDAALEWAARCPAAVHGAVEVRPLAPAGLRLRVMSPCADS
jgi:hypothetical protein